VELTGAARGIDAEEVVEPSGRLAGCVDGMRRWSLRGGARGRVAVDWSGPARRKAAVAVERTGAARSNEKKQSAEEGVEGRQEHRATRPDARDGVRETYRFFLQSILFRSRDLHLFPSPPLLLPPLPTP
jgi:hypothetical protein